jgi:hypothetical protein
VLVGKTNPRTQKPYGREIREGLGGIRHLVEARLRRDLRLGEIRREEAHAIGTAGGTLEEALTIAKGTEGTRRAGTGDDPCACGAADAVAVERRR